MSPSISILIVDDHEVVRQGLRAYLSAQPDLEVVAEAASGEEAVRVVSELAPDVALMDLLMPGMDGIEATRQLKKVSPRTQVVVLTSFHEDEHIFPALRAGAISYLLKDVKMDEMAAAVRRAAQGEATLHPRIAARLIQEIHGGQAAHSNAAHSSAAFNPYTGLTERELEVLRLVANGLSNSEIAAQMVISENTVKGHVSNILSKLHLADRTQAAVFAWKEGVVRK